MSSNDIAPRAGAAKLGYRPELDGVRGIAISSVVLMHTVDWPRGGFLGVDLFFVLSGFLITTLLVQEWQMRETIALRGFYRRRALRLLPGLVAVIAAYVTVRFVVDLRHPELPKHHLDRDLGGALAGLFYVSNIVQAGGVAFPPGIRHLWSLGTEEQFYLLWPPLLLLALVRAANPIRRLQTALIFALGLVVSWRFALTVAGTSQHRLYFAPDTSCDTLIIGCILGLWFTTGSFPSVLRGRNVQRLLPPVAAATLLALMFSTRDWSDRSLFAGTITLFALASAVLIANVVLEPDGALGRALRVEPLVFTGRISYSLYLWPPIILTQTNLAPIPALAASFTAATASYYGVERPFLRRKYIERRRPVGGTEALPAKA
jgi:peptidoglycan/LPS O-acetylase OafA/YrhL